MRQLYTLQIYIVVTQDYMQTGLLGTSSCTGLYERKIQFEINFVRQTEKNNNKYQVK